MCKGSHRGPLHAADVYGADSPAAPTAPGEEPSPALPGAAPSCGPGRGRGSGEGLRVSRPRSDGGKTMIMMHVGQLGESGFCSVLSRGCTHLAALSPVPVVRPAGSGGADLGRLDPRQRRARGMATPAGRGLEHSKRVAKAPWPRATVRLPVPAISAALPAHRKWSMTLRPRDDLGPDVNRFRPRPLSLGPTLPAKPAGSSPAPPRVLSLSLSRLALSLAPARARALRSEPRAA